MDNVDDIQKIASCLRNKADVISTELGGAPVIVIVAGDAKANIPRTITATSMVGGENAKLRDVLGILQSSIQIESYFTFTSNSSS